MIRYSTFQRQYGGGDPGLGSCFPEQVTKQEYRFSYKIKGSRGMEADHNNIDPTGMELINTCDYTLVVTGN